MDFEWVDYYEAAQDFYDLALSTTDVSKKRKRESYLRSSISRAYYAALQSAKEYLVDHNLYYPSEYDKRVIHQYIIDRCRLLRDPRGKRIRDALDILRGNRVKADYEKTFPLKHLETLESKAEESLIQARYAIELVAKLK